MLQMLSMLRLSPVLQLRVLSPWRSAAQLPSQVQQGHVRQSLTALRRRQRHRSVCPLRARTPKRRRALQHKMLCLDMTAQQQQRMLRLNRPARQQRQRPFSARALQAAKLGASGREHGLGRISALEQRPGYHTLEARKRLLISQQVDIQ